MTLSRLSTRFVAFTGALAMSTALLFVAPQAHAAKDNGAYYSAELAQTAPAKKELIRGVFVKCSGGKCSAPLASAAAKNMCVAIAREFGEVKSFKAGERTFDAAQIAACNEKSSAKIAG